MTKNNHHKIAAKYAKALNRFDVAAIELLLHDDFKYYYFFRKIGLDVLEGKKQFLQHLKNCFAEMKANKLAINASMKYFVLNKKVVPCLVLSPPHYFQFLYPTTEPTKINVQKGASTNDLFMSCNFEKNLLKSFEVMELVPFDDDKFRVESLSLKTEINFVTF